MRYLILLLIFSCSMPIIDNNWHDLEKAPEELRQDFTYYKLITWIVNNFQQTPYANGFKPAQKTMDSKTGNCANLALLQLAIVYKLNGVKGQLVYCKNIYGLHYCCRFENKIYEGGITEIYEVINFDDIAEYIYYRQ